MDVDLAPALHSRLYEHSLIQTIFTALKHVRIQVSDLVGLARSHYRAALRRRNALPMTDTELRLIAALAMTGDNSTPKKG